MTVSTQPIPHGRQTFHLKSWRDLVSKLEFEIDEFDRTRLLDTEPEFRTYRAINATVTAWHIGDWFWAWILDDRSELVPEIARHLGITVDPAVARDKTRLAKLLSSGMVERHRSLSICRTVSNAFKHSRSERFPDMLTTHPVHVLQLLPHSNKATGDTYFDLRVFADGAVLDMDEVLKQAAAAWTDLFRAAGLWSIRGGWSED